MFCDFGMIQEDASKTVDRRISTSEHEILSTTSAVMRRGIIARQGMTVRGRNYFAEIKKEMK